MTNKKCFWEDSKMPSAICPHCKEPAYSSAAFDEPWTCPSCGQTVIPPEDENGPKRGERESYVERYSRFWTRVD